MFKRNRIYGKDLSSVVEGLKKIYEKKIKPVEELYHFADFHSPLMTSSDFDAKPMVLLIGQYSTGKTTFIEYVLRTKYPGSNIGPEPTTGIHSLTHSLTHSRTHPSCLLDPP